MSKAQQEKELTLEGKTFRIKKFTPDVASYWAFQLFGDLSAFAVSAGTGGMSAVQEKLPKLVRDFTRMDREKFREFQRDSLSFVLIRFEHEGFVPLINSQGHYAAHDISSPTLFKLTTDSFLFTIQDFFLQWLQDDGILAGAEPEQSGPTNAPKTGSENSSITQ